MDTMKDTKMQPATDAVIEELRNRLEAAEKDVARKEKVIDALGSGLNAVAKERDELRAKIERMEKQESSFRERCTPAVPAGGSNRFPLYALPGAKGE